MTLKHIFATAVMAAATAVSLTAQTINGDWTGRLDVGQGQTLKLLLHVNEAKRTITIDSPDQGVYGIECKANFLQGDSISLSVPAFMFSYAGRLSDGAINGTFKQNGAKLPLTFTAGVKKAQRPQTPKPPYPYTMEEVEIVNPLAESTTLSGTLTLPRYANGPIPVVVLVSGSGLQNRDEEIFEHKPFAVIADFLARYGIASLRYDDRGYGKSTGDATTATTADFATDAKAIIDWLRAQKRFTKVGIVGHSEGGSIAYMLGAAEDGPDFIVSIAGPAIVGSKILDYQNKSILLKNGMTEEQAEETAVNARKQLEADPAQKWLHYFLRYDPANDLASLKVPALIIYGGKDCQVPQSLNYQAAKKLAPKAKVRCFPQLNHLMQHATTGGVEEYNSIEETFAPEALEEITTFIRQLPQ